MFGLPAQDKPMSKEDLRNMKEMLHTIRDDIKENYFDRKFNGLDVNLRFDEAEKKIETAPSVNYALSDIAGAVGALKDSHTYFIPPPRPFKHSYGLEMQAVGNDCFITAVRPGSDAEKKGLKPGDQILSVNGYSAIREDIGKIKLVFNTLRPQARLRLVVRPADAGPRQVDALANIRPTDKMRDLTDYWSFIQEKRDYEMIHRSRFVEYGSDVIIWKLPDFVFMPDQAGKMLDRIRSHKALILDLRGNPGGSVEFLVHFLGGMLDHDVKVGDFVSRHGIQTQKTKSRGDKTFGGRLVVLVDSESASASEIFARVVQLEKRGTVVGDVSSGMVMESKMYPHRLGGMMVMTFYAASITAADIIMSDGKSLENVGVVPDFRIVPTPIDLATQRDPALAYAASLVDLQLTPEVAGRMFPVEWPAQ
jgi:C-terminal processing protease CtpA/Prc